MAEFCTCGSIKIDGNCTNKNCINRDTAKPTKSRTAKKTTTSGKSASKSAKTRKASKVITYNLYDTDEKENIE